MVDFLNDWKAPQRGGIVLMGSCFSDELKMPLIEQGFEVMSNPFGTLFHPSVIFNWLNQAAEMEVNEESWQMVYHEQVWKSLQAGKEFRMQEKQQLLQKITACIHELNHALSQAVTLVITLGTAHAWRHQELGIVGNCQRLPQQDFVRVLTSLSDLVSEGKRVIENLHRAFPSLRIVFTISPVKHWRMGVLENVQTKSRLIEFIYEIREWKELDYFPSFELITEVLRNDEYFELDRCHPNKRAIQEVIRNFLK
ncbi:MAG: GSCFA domain-containing protein [Bacteroidota bacterium]